MPKDDACPLPLGDAVTIQSHARIPTMNQCHTPNNVKVSALILTYNHEPFIAEAIEGFLMQKTNFPCELVITEDCSTDQTRDVIQQYCQRYPDRISCDAQSA